MRKLNKKGFTLVELLAVIVILSVVMLVAVTAVGPAITNSKKSAFFSSCASLVDAATIYATSTGLTATKCVTSDWLVSQGYLTVKDAKFKGAVKIAVSGNSYTYAVVATNEDFGAGALTSAGAATTKTLTALRTAENTYSLAAKFNWVSITKVDGTTMSCS
jgi:type IV pilus assembly protein PilA